MHRLVERPLSFTSRIDELTDERGLLESGILPSVEGTVWLKVSTVPQKVQYFCVDPSFREGWSVGMRELGNDAFRVFQRVVTVILKPDALLGRRGQQCIDYIAKHSFTPVHFERITLSRLQTQELWRYWGTMATLDRLRLSQQVSAQGEALMVFFRDDSPALTVPATVRLQALKGSAYPGYRSPHHLRSVLQAPNRVVVLVHTPDEPMDMVRELGVVFTDQELARVYRHLARYEDLDVTPAVRREIDSIYGSSHQVGLDVDQAAAELQASTSTLQRRGSSRTVRLAAGAAHATLAAARAGAGLKWSAWSEDLRAAGIRPSGWIPTLVGTEYIQHDVPGASCLITESGCERWAEGLGTMHRFAA
jgi:hypothetical protein